MLVVNGVELTLVDQLHQMGELHRDHARRRQQRLHAGGRQREMLELEVIRVRARFGIDRELRRPSEEWPGYYHWPQALVGYKYQPTNVQASINIKIAIPG